MKWYGSINNRLEENNMFCEEIKVGTGMTEYDWSDREAYEVVAVKDQKHVTVRKFDHKLRGAAMSNDWELISNEENPEIDLERRGKYWYRVNTVTKEMLEAAESDFEKRLWLALNGYDPEVIREKGKQTKRTRMNVSFGHADYYYDYEF